MLPWQTEFQSNQPKNLMQPFPLPKDALHEMWSKLVNWLRDFESVDGQQTNTILIPHLSLGLRWAKKHAKFPRRQRVKNPLPVIYLFESSIQHDTYSKPCVKMPLKIRQNKDLYDKW